eukprot:TRINITY_DN533_c0_g1_i1.p1 TRINITY_DN533_c0_g1~~TRINITY_DN533_c0_g1_i1.p1  ORF type:complete len:319 (-),score=87.56 TRINITY_DN533_c0_g1_i1:403-1359(-)
MYARRLLAKRLANDPFVGDYKISDEEVGEGSNSVVRIAHHCTNNSQVIAKILIKKTGTPSSSPFASPMSSPAGSPTGISPAILANYQSLAQKVKDEMFREIVIMNRLFHQNIVKPLQIIEEESYIFLFMEYMEEGDIYSYIQKHGSFEESRAKELFIQMISALVHCHENKICHHDIKLENFVMNEGKVKLIDFGYAIDYSTRPPNELFHIFNGSPAYSAPEVLDRKPHNESVDTFSLGTCLYYMIAAEFPFCDETRTTYEQLVRNVRMGKFVWPDHFSTELRDLLSKMMAKSGSRMEAKDVLNHPWITSSNSCAMDCS